MHSQKLAAFVAAMALPLGACSAPAAGEESRGSTTSHLDEPPRKAALDTDLDGEPDETDCDPASSELRRRFVEDDLATAKGHVRAADGFRETSWTHADGAWVQSRAKDRADASFLTATVDGPVLAKARFSVEEISSYDSLRQTFVLVGATSSTSDFEAFGCGIEVIAGVPKASLVRLDGKPGHVRTRGIKRADRKAIHLGDRVDVTVRVTDDSITCTIEQDNDEVTLVAFDEDARTGSVGFYTYESGAAFESARVCGLAR